MFNQYFPIIEIVKIFLNKKMCHLITIYIIYSLLLADQRQDRADRPVDRRLEEGRQTEGRAGEEDRGGRVRTRKLQV